MDIFVHLHNDDGLLYEDFSDCRRLIGRLLCLTTIRPNITFVVKQLSQFIAKPTQTHHIVVVRVLKYIKGALTPGLLFFTTSVVQVKAYCDSDWASCHDTYKSIIGYYIHLNYSLSCWRSKIQNTVSQSSCEAEYRDMATTTCEIQWITDLLQDIQVDFKTPSLLYCDNQTALHITANLVFHERAKHIGIDSRVVREKSSSSLLKLLSVSSSLKLTNVFTKPFNPRLFRSNHAKLVLLDIHAPICRRLLTAAS